MTAPSEQDPDPGEATIERLRRVFGPEVDPQVQLDAEGGPEPRGASGAGPSSGALRRLGARAPGATRYRMGGEIARGGMGAILEVWDEDLRRRLAMKVALGRDTSSGSSGARSDELEPRVLARFLEEAQITGQLDHPGIVPVHELGLDADGRVFFTMRLVRGRDLGHVFRLVTEGEEGWTVTRALGVLLKACEAMAFAHSKGVIHRDLKPANVMVGRFGEVYVMDWGLARVLGAVDRHDLRLTPAPGATAPADAAPVDVAPRADASGESREELYTMDGDVIGTPAYMAPEQARGALETLDARADVYSLGAMLYRLLTGAPPYMPRGERPSSAVVLERLLAGPPPSLERLGVDAPAELVAICDKAMARAPGGRYADMLALAEDLRAFLEGRVVRAYETGAWAEARKWVRRNKPLAASLAAGVLALAGGLAAALVQKGRADENATLAETRRVEAVAAAGLAEERRVEADRQAAAARRQARISEEVNAFLNDDLLAAVAPDQVGVDVTVREVLEGASAQLAGRFEDEPLVEAELRMTIGTSFARLGEYERAAAHLERAYALRRAELGERAEETLQSMTGLASAWSELGRYDASLDLYDRAVEGLRNALGPEHRGTLSAQSDRAMVYADLGRLEEARASHERVLDAMRRTLGPEHPDTLSSLNNLAVVLQDLGQLERAEELLQQAVEARRRRQGDRHPATLNALNNLALVCEARGRFDEAERLHREGLAIRREVLGPDHPETAQSEGNLGVLLLKLGRGVEAEPLLRSGLAAARAAHGPDHPLTLLAMNNVATVCERLGRYDEALALRLDGLARQRAVLGPDHPQTLTSMNNLAGLYRDTGRLEEAEALFRETVALYADSLGMEHPSALLTLENLGGVLYRRGDYAGTEEILLEVLAGRERALGPDHPAVARTIYNMGMLRRSTGDREGALELFEEALARNRETLGDAHAATAECLAQVGAEHVEAARWAQAEAAYGEALEVRRRLGPDDAEVGLLLHQLAFARLQQDDLEGARAGFEDALALRRELHGDDDHATLTSMYSLAFVLRGQGALDQALELAAEAYERRAAQEGTTGPEARRARELLARICEDQGRPEDAARWREER